MLVGCGNDEPEATTEEAALEVPEGAVAFVDEVDDGEVSQSELDAIVQYRAISQGFDPPLVEGTPEYSEVLPNAFFELLFNRWVRGEADELAISVTETQIDAELETIVSQQYASQDEYERFLEDSGLTEEDARARVEGSAPDRSRSGRGLSRGPEASGARRGTGGISGGVHVEVA